MQITLLFIGKTSEQFVIDGFKKYFDRISKYNSIRTIEIPDIKNRKSRDTNNIKLLEAEEIIKKIPEKAFVVLLSERGKEMTSVEFSEFLKHKINISIKEIVFIVGGAYGVDEKIENISDFILSFSKMTFTHQFIRLMLTEQIYRAFSILNNEPYHNE